jgi:hypothetical protein
VKESDSPVTIKAIGVKAGMADSSIAQATYTIQYWFIFAALTETEVSGPDDADW